jgi:lysyl-tRNA synthetase, class II
VTGAEPDFLLAVARDGGGRAVGFLRLVPAYGPDPGYSLDLMRRRPEAENGVSEFLICNTASGLGERGFHRLSMNFAAWGRLFHGDVRLSPPQRVLRWFVDRLNPYFQIRSLYEFSLRFDPQWLPRSIVVEDAAALPHVGLLYASVEGFVRVPRLGSRLVPHVRHMPQLSGLRAPAARAREAAAG